MDSGAIRAGFSLRQESIAVDTQHLQRLRGQRTHNDSSIRTTFKPAVAQRLPQQCGGKGATEVFTPFRPIQTVAQHWPCGFGCDNTQLAQDSATCAGEAEPRRRVQQTLCRHPVSNGDAESTSQVVIASSRGSQSPRTHGGGQSVNRAPFRVFRQALHQLGNVRTGQSNIGMPPLPHSGNEIAATQLLDMLTGRRRRHFARFGQFSHGPRTPIQHRHAHRGPRRVREKRSNLGQVHGVHDLERTTGTCRPAPNDRAHAQDRPSTVMTPTECQRKQWHQTRAHPNPSVICESAVHHFDTR